MYCTGTQFFIDNMSRSHIIYAFIFSQTDLLVSKAPSIVNDVRNNFNLLHETEYGYAGATAIQ